MSSPTSAPQPPPSVEASSSAIERTTPFATAPIPTSANASDAKPYRYQPHYPRGTKIVEMTNGRQFVSRPLDSRLISGNRLPNNQQQYHPPHHSHNNRFGQPYQPHMTSYHPNHNTNHRFIQQQHGPYDRPYNNMMPLPRQNPLHTLHQGSDYFSKSSSMEALTRQASSSLYRHQGSQSSRHHALPQPLRHQYSHGHQSSGFIPSQQHHHPSSLATSQQQQFVLSNALGRPKNSGLAIGRPVSVQEILGHSGHRVAAPQGTSSISQQKRSTPSAASSMQLQSLFQKQSSSSLSPTVKPTDKSATTPLMKLLENTHPMVANTMTTPMSDSRAIVGSSKPQAPLHTNPPSLVAEMIAAAGSLTDSQSALTTHQHRRYTVDSTTLKSSPRMVNNGIQWLFDAASATIQSPRSPWTTDNSTPSISAVSSPPASAPTQQSQFIEDAWEFNRGEDLMDDELLFRREELQRRRNPRYLAKTKRLHDLHIVMPICVPYGKIVVDDPLGANFYQFNDKPKNAGAEILFGKGIADAKKTEEDSEGCESKENETPIDKKQEKKEGANGVKPVCDVWASFLHVRLGTIYNLTASHMPIVADLFKRSFDQDLCKFYVPITLDCRGVHPSSDELISQRAARPSQLIKDTKDGRKSVAERYETHAVPTSENDVKRLRMVRRHLRKFAFRLINDLGFDSGPSLMRDYPNEHPMQTSMRIANEMPKPCVELHDNCRSETITNGSLKIVVREWSPLSDPEVFKRVWAGQLASPNHSAAHHSGVAAEVRTKLLEHKTIPSARVLAGELRLEHNHLRMVDPRWPEELVPGRRVADSCPENEAPGPEESQARFVFCSRVANPQIVYGYAESDGSDPRDAALACRLSALFKVHLARHPTAGVKTASTFTTHAPSTSLTPEPHTETSTPIGGRSPHDTVSAASRQIEGKQGESEIVESDEKKQRPDVAEKKETVQQPPLIEEVQHKPITSLSELKTLPEPFVPVLPESRHFLSHYYDKSEMPQLLQLMLHQTSEAERVISDQSALKADAAFKVPLTTVPCKYFLKGGGCARGSECYFLHPADPKLESKVDVRHIVPKHPKFF